MIYQKLAWLNHALPRGLEDRIKYLDNRKVKFGVNRRRGALGISPKRPDHHGKCVATASRNTSRFEIGADPKYLYRPHLHVHSLPMILFKGCEKSLDEAK